ncbi:MAG: ABC transporter permease [Opitutaceae bacterium]|nr:ABC transporter permease [Opitutaceae bacterium]
MSFILRMAWRDTRASRRRLAFFSLSIVFGVAALVAIGSLKENLTQAIEEQTKSLLGADLTANGRSEWPKEVADVFATLGEARAQEVAFSSMAIAPGEQGGSRLVQVRALEGPFPFYGEFDVVPNGARNVLDEGGRVAIVEETLLAQLGLTVGGEVRLGAATFRVVGALKAVPGESSAITQLAPRVFVPLSMVRETELLTVGSLARYRMYFKFGPGTDVAEVERGLRARFPEHRIGYDTVAERKQELGQAIQSVNTFLSLVGFASLLLGALGVASAVQAYMVQKVPTVAVLRCLGTPVHTCLAIYAVQGLGLGLAGAAVGAALGVGVHAVLPSLLASFLPFAFETSVSWAGVARGVGAGALISTLFALLPLVSVRRISPLLAIRSSLGVATRSFDPAVAAIAALLGAAVVAFAWTQTGRLSWALGFALALAVVLGALWAVARAVTWLARRSVPRRVPFAWRQGVSNLYRPQNRTVFLVVTLGVGAFLLMTLALTRDTLLGQLRIAGAADRSNMIFFDVQDDQVEPLASLLETEGAPVRQQAPIVTMRLSHLKGRPVTAVLKADDNRVPGWTLRREYRSTFRGQLVGTERLVAGTFVAEAPATGPVPISLELGLAKDLGVNLGDTLTFDVQGVAVETVVSSLREVDWRRMEPNFFVVFPREVLEPAPKFHVVAVRVGDPAHSARVQRAVAVDFPNVSVVDLGLITATIDRLYAKASFVVEFLALFTVATGLLVLMGTVLIGRAARARESVLFRTLGASQRQVQQMLLVEYAALGTLGAAVGAVLAVGANQALALVVFRLPWAWPSWWVLGGGWLLFTGATVLVGMASNRGLHRLPPLAVLRQET